MGIWRTHAEITREAGKTQGVNPRRSSELHVSRRMGTSQAVYLEHCPGLVETELAGSWALNCPSTIKIPSIWFLCKCMGAQFVEDLKEKKRCFGINSSKSPIRRYFFSLTLTGDPKLLWWALKVPLCLGLDGLLHLSRKSLCSNVRGHWGHGEAVEEVQGGNTSWEEKGEVIGSDIRRSLVGRCSSRRGYKYAFRLLAQ